MHKRQILTGLLILAIVGLLAGCGQGTAITEEETVLAAVREAGDRIAAEAAVEPARWVVLRLGGGGAITEALVEEGDRVSAGDVLLRIDTADAQLAVQQAEAALAAAQAQLALVKAGARPQQIGVIEAQLEAAEAVVAQAAAQRDEQNAGLVEADIVAAQAQVAAAASAHRQADEAHDETMKCYDVTLPDGSEHKACPGLGPYEETARYQMESASAALVAAQAQLDALQGAANPQAAAAQAGVQAALAQRDAAQAQLDLALAGSRAQEIALAEAGVQQAEAALAQARAQSDLVVLKAPFDGIVTALPFDAGDTVAPGEPLATLATLDRLQIKTTDLTELDAVRMAVGQPVIVTLDAMRDRPLAGHVVRVDRQSTDHHGDVIYPVIVELDETSPDWLRWGMTAQVEIQMSSSPISAAPVETIGDGLEVE
ncbi:MAG: HlyD family efflux transporter periplasmic adaptor subunit, partial [Chloroflexota bacterium]|nr:HlyD family efflux transporter periplasmic adaptor subunit [Chloroflexota bacterium]